MSKDLCSTCKFLLRDDDVDYFECTKEDELSDAQYNEFQEGTVKNCPFYEEDPVNFLEFDEDFDLDDDVKEEGPRYTVSYEGYIFAGDNEDGWNSHDFDKWEDIQKLINNCGDKITVKDNYYGVTWEDGEWY